MDRRAFLGAMGGLPAWLAFPGVGMGAQDEGSSFQEMTPAQEEANRKGLVALAKLQGPSGEMDPKYGVAFTALGGLAFLASGSTPNRGPYSDNILRATRFLLRMSHPSGFINDSSHSRGGSGMHGHGYATLFLAELYGTLDSGLGSGNADIRDALVRAVKVIEDSQDKNGGWTYDPKPTGHEGSVTVTQVQALRAARNCGISVKKGKIEKGIEYIRKSTRADGSVAYSLGSRTGGSFALTAAGMCVFHYLGLHNDPKLRRGMKKMDDIIGGKEKKRGGVGGSHYYYAMLYAGQAVWFERRVDKAYYERNYAILRSDLLGKQGSDGSWSDHYGPAFGTACALLVLQIPYRILSIFES